MKQKTIGEVFRLARERQELSLDSLAEKTAIKKEDLLALEADEFREFSVSVLRSFLARYATALDLDQKIILSAYQSGSLVTYGEIEEDVLIPAQKRKYLRIKRVSYLPLCYLALVSLTILAFVLYFVGRYTPSRSHSFDSSAGYKLVTTSQSSSNKNDSKETSPSLKSHLFVTGEGDHLDMTLSDVDQPVLLELSTVKGEESWVCVTGTPIEKGVTLSSHRIARVMLEHPSTTRITIGHTRGIQLRLDHQAVDLSPLTSLSATITLTIK